MKHKKLFAILTLVCFMFTLMPVAAMAEGEEVAVDNKGVYFTSLADAFQNTTGSIITLLKDAEYSYGARTELGMNGDITIDGDNHTLSLKGTDTDWSSIGNANGKLTFKNMTINKTEPGNGAWNNHAINFTTEVAFENVTVNNSVAVGANASFTNVNFVENGEYYTLWIKNNVEKVTVDECTFTAENNGRGIKIADQYVDEAEQTKVKLEVTNSTFKTAKKAAILVTSTKGADITTSGNDITSVTADSAHLVWVDEGEAYVDSFAEVTVKDEQGEPVAGALTIEGITAPVATVDDVPYASLQDALNAAAAGSGEVTVEILGNIDLTDVVWNPVTVSGPGYPLVTVNGNNKIIAGLNDMLFAGTWAGDSGLIINDLTIKDSNIVHDENDKQGTVGVGAFIGYPQASETITLNNCHLVDSTVKGGHWTGGLIGMAGGYNGNDGPVFMNLTIKDCSVTDSTITGKGSVGGVIGHGSCAAWTNVVITDTEVKNNTITSTGDSNVKAGTVMGTIGAAGQPTTAAGETKTGGATISVTETGNIVTSNGTTITTVYGRQGTETGMLIITGGTYDNNPIEEDVEYAKPAEGYAIVENEDGTYGVKKAVTGVALSPETATVEIGKTVTLTATVTPEDAYNKNATWSSNNESVATVVDGVVTGVTTGSAIITVTTEDGGYTDTCTVTVTAIPTYTVTYTDGVEDAVIFDDVVYTVESGSATPAFDGTPTRSGYTFAGWSPEVADTVTGDATYSATWTKNSTSYYYGGGVSTSVSIASDDNATVKVSDKYADKGETVTITVDTKDGFYAKDVVVTDKNGEAITVTRVALDKWEFTMPSGKVKVDVDTAEYSNEVVLQIGDLDIAVNDAVIQSDVAPFIKNDRTMVPISVIVYALGGTTDWNSETRTVTVTLDGKVLTMVIDEIIPGFGAAAIIVDSRTYVPIGYVADVLGCDVDWIAATRQVVIVK